MIRWRSLRPHTDSGFSSSGELPHHQLGTDTDVCECVFGGGGSVRGTHRLLHSSLAAGRGVFGRPHSGRIKPVVPLVSAHHSRFHPSPRPVKYPSGTPLPFPPHFTPRRHWQLSTRATKHHPTLLLHTVPCHHPRLPFSPDLPGPPPPPPPWPSSLSVTVSSLPAVRDQSLCSPARRLSAAAAG